MLCVINRSVAKLSLAHIKKKPEKVIKKNKENNKTLYDSHRACLIVLWLSVRRSRQPSQSHICLRFDPNGAHCTNIKIPFSFNTCPVTDNRVFDTILAGKRQIARKITLR